MMPADTRRIEFIPMLPPERRGLVNGWRGQPSIKVNAVYDKPFWRADGLSGVGLSDKAPIGVTFDNSPHDGSRGVLMAFLTEDELPRDQSQRRHQVLAGLARLFGSRAKSPLAYFETDWSRDGWSTGCVSPLPRNILSRFGPRLADTGRLRALGRDRDVRCLVRLHGRRRPVRRTRRHRSFGGTSHLKKGERPLCWPTSYTRIKVSYDFGFSLRVPTALCGNWAMEAHRLTLPGEPL